MLFVNFTKAFDIINRKALWNILRKLGYPDHFVTEFSFLYESKSWETFFSRRMDSGKNLTKEVKFLRAPSLKLFRRPGKKIQLLEVKRKKLYRLKFEARERKKKRKLYQPVRKHSARNLKQKKGKRKTNFEFRHHIGISVKNCFVMYNFFCFIPTSSKSIWLSNPFVYIPLLYFLCYIKCCGFCSTMLSETCAISAEMSFEMYLLNSFLLK